MMENFESEKQQLDLNVQTTKICAEALQQSNKNSIRQWIVISILLALCTFLIFDNIYMRTTMEERIASSAAQAISKSQETFNEAVLKALEAVGEIEVTREVTTTTTQTADGGSAINNVNGDQYNDSEINNECGGLNDGQSVTDNNKD